MSRKLNLLVLQKTGITLKEFCEQQLKTEYKAFQMRMRKNRYHPAEVVYICWRLRVSCEEAFGKSIYDLVLFMGKNEAPAKARDLWAKASDYEKTRLLALIGIEPPSLVKPEEKLRVKQQARATAVFDEVENLLDNGHEQIEDSPSPEQKAEDPLAGLYQETY